MVCLFVLTGIMLLFILAVTMTLQVESLLVSPLRLLVLVVRVRILVTWALGRCRVKACPLSHSGLATKTTIASFIGRYIVSLVLIVWSLVKIIWLDCWRRC